MDSIRPHDSRWNFIEEDHPEKLEHLLRAKADPTKPYIDSRVQDLLTLIEAMGQHLRTV